MLNVKCVCWCLSIIELKNVRWKIENFSVVYFCCFFHSVAWHYSNAKVDSFSLHYSTTKKLSAEQINCTKLSKGEGNIFPTHAPKLHLFSTSVLDGNEWPSSRLRQLLPPLSRFTNWIKTSVHLTVDLDVLKQRKVWSLYRESKHDFSFSQSVA